MPVQLQDVNTEDYIVIPKGRIVSALSTEDSTTSGIVYPNSSGYVPIGYAAAEAGAALIQENIDTGYFGYSEYIAGLLTLCNGGTQCASYYTSYDVTAQTLIKTGTVATASGAYTIAANAPIGVAFHDWYQDIRGKYLNYEMHPDGGHVLTDWYVEVPYIKVQSTGSIASGTPQYQTGDYANLLKWYDINKSFTYLNVGLTDTFRNGLFVKSDLIGNYKIQTETANASGWTLNSSVVDLPRTNQTVGKILAIDNRFPKGGLEDVLTYPRSGMPGSQTGGMIKVLFDFVYQVYLLHTASAPTIETIYSDIRKGYFGLARIQLSVS
jgi:hypothetical protein